MDSVDKRKILQVDFDGTWAEYYGWEGPHAIGKPIPGAIETISRLSIEGCGSKSGQLGRMKVFLLLRPILRNIAPRSRSRRSTVGWRLMRSAFVIG